MLGHGTSQAPQAVFIGLRNCYVARFGQAPKLQNLRSSFRWPWNLTPLRSSFRRRALAWPWYLPRPHKLFLLGFETAMWHVLGRPQKPKTSAAAFAGLGTSHPPQQLSKASRLLGHGTSLGPTSCFSWASKLPRGTVWAGPKSLKTSAAALEGLGTSQPSAATFEGAPLAWPWFRNCYVARFGQALKASKPPQQLSKALEPHNPPQQLSEACRLLGHGTSLGPTSCYYWACGFYWASKLLCGTFWAGLTSLKTSAAAFEGLRTSQPSAAAFEGVPLAWPWYLPNRSG